MPESAKAVEKRRPYEEALARMRSRAEIEGNQGSGFEIAANVADQILQADSIEGIIAAAAAGPGSLEDIVGKPFYFKGYLRVLNSAEQFREGGTGQYVVFDIEDMNGNSATYSTGAVNVVFQLHALELQGYFASEDWKSDKLFTFRSRPTAGGQLFRVDFA